MHIISDSQSASDQQATLDSDDGRTWHRLVEINPGWGTVSLRGVSIFAPSTDLRCDSKSDPSSPSTTMNASTVATESAGCTSWTPGGTITLIELFNFELGYRHAEIIASSRSGASSTCVLKQPGQFLVDMYLRQRILFDMAMLLARQPVRTWSQYPPTTNLYSDSLPKDSCKMYRIHNNQGCATGLQDWVAVSKVSSSSGSFTNVSSLDISLQNRHDLNLESIRGDIGRDVVRLGECRQFHRLREAEQSRKFALSRGCRSRCADYGKSMAKTEY